MSYRVGSGSNQLLVTSRREIVSPSPALNYRKASTESAGPVLRSRASELPISVENRLVVVQRAVFSNDSHQEV